MEQVGEVLQEKEEGSLLEEDWSEEYQADPEFAELWSQMEAGASGRQGIIRRKGPIYRNHLLCIPAVKKNRLIPTFHSHAGHPGGDRFWPQLLS